MDEEEGEMRRILLKDNGNKRRDRTTIGSCNYRIFSFEL